MPAVPRRGPGTNRYTSPAVYPYCCFQAPVAALPAPFSYTHRPGRSGRHGPAGWGVDFPIPQNSFGCVLQEMGSRVCRRVVSRQGPRGECGMPAGQARAVYPVPPTLYRPPKPSTLYRPPKPSTLYRPPRTALPEPPSQAVYPVPPSQNRPPKPSTLYRPPPTRLPCSDLPTRLPCTAHQRPSTLYRLPCTAHPSRPPCAAHPEPSRLPCTAHHQPVHPGPTSQPVCPVPPTKARLPWTAYPFYSLDIYFTRSLSPLSLSL